MPTIELRPRREQKTWTTPTGEVIPLFEADGTTPVPLVPDQWAVHLVMTEAEAGDAGRRDWLIGYCGKKKHQPITLTEHVPEVIRELVESHVREKVGGFKGDRAAMVPEPAPIVEEDDDDADDST